jgi:hypothetical protein
MTALEAFDQQLSKTERLILSDLTTPHKIQEFLDGIPYSTEPVYRCPLQVLRDRVAHCFDGALFAAAMMRRIGHPPVITDMLPNNRDDDHLLAVFCIEGHWGAVAKSNFTGLRYREPIYLSLRELIMSYFEQYYNVAGEKTLRGYTAPLDLTVFDGADWMISNAGLEQIAQRTDEISRFALLTPQMEAGLSKVDERSLKAGLLGAEDGGLFKPGN